MYTYQTLENTDHQLLHRIFSEAFSDYMVTMDVPFDAFENMLQGRGFAPRHSIGAFTNSGQELVGFVLNGKRNRQDKSSAYDIATGIVPTHRKRGVGNGMFQKVVEVLTQDHVEQYILEVLQPNQAAFELYKKQGFSIAKSYGVFKLAKNDYVPKPHANHVEYVQQFETNDWKCLSSFWDFEPSWQNSIDTIKAIPHAFHCAVVRLDNQIVGYGLIDKNTGDIPQIAVRKDYRRKGIAGSIVAALVERTQGSRIRVINVEDRCEEMKLFLRNEGFDEYVKQYEMVLPIG